MTRKSKPRPYPNFDKVQHASIRKKIDAKFLKRMRELDDCYYGTTTAWDKEGLTTKRKKDGWRDGGKAEFEGHKPATKADAFELFTKLQALLNWDYDLAKMDESAAQGHPYPDLEKRCKDKTRRSQLAKCIADTGLVIPRTLDRKTDMTRAAAAGGFQ